MHGRQARQAGKQSGQACRPEISQTGRQPRQADSSQAADKQAKLKANKVRQAEGPRKLKGEPGKAGKLGLKLLDLLYSVISYHIILYYIIVYSILSYYIIIYHINYNIIRYNII